MIHNYADINECEENIAGCNQYCNNTEGSFFCSCFEGFILRNDSLTCVGMYIYKSSLILLLKLSNACNYDCFLDYNECEEESHGCERVCINDMGSFHCECRRGFFLMKDGKSCTRKL